MTQRRRGGGYHLILLKGWSQITSILTRVFLISLFILNDQRQIYNFFLKLGTVNLNLEKFEEKMGSRTSHTQNICHTYFDTGPWSHPLDETGKTEWHNKDLSLPTGLLQQVIGPRLTYAYLKYLGARPSYTRGAKSKVSSREPLACWSTNRQCDFFCEFWREKNWG